MNGVYNSILGPINVTSVDVTYYDSASGFIQPVFSFTASWKTGVSENKTGEAITIQGYIPSAKNLSKAFSDSTTQAP